MIRFRTGWGRPLSIAACTLMTSLAFCGLALASGGEGGGHGGGNVTDLLYRILNFVLLVIILAVVIRKTTIKDFFANRKEEIRQKLESLKRDKEAAEGLCGELEKKLREFEVQKKAIIDQFRADGAAEKEKIIKEARERAAQILAQAEMTIERQVQGAKDRLRQDVAEIAAAKANDIIAQQITDSDQDHLVSEFIERVERLH
ncbi:MAG: F-type H+-transporting ATPase subunit b [Thermodesulfobacteriota bacterium]|nr:F-type H+-transporting ATPase subunit b [Thermodesulfobacteriota bacterium]